MIDPSDQNHTTNVYRVKESTNSKLQNKSLFSLGTRRIKSEGVEYNLYRVKDAGDKSYKVEAKVGVFKVNEEMNKKYGDLSHKDADVAAFAEIGDDAIQSAEIAEKGDIPDKKGEPGNGPNANTILDENGLEIVKIPGRGDCFFQSVAYCILADSKFLKANKDEAPWAHENFEVPDNYDAMKKSEDWIPILRKHVARAVAAADYVHAREMAFQLLDRKKYVKMSTQIKDAKPSKVPGSIFLQKKKWYLVDGKGEEELILYTGKGRPFPPIWEESKTTVDKWREEEKMDAEKMEGDADAAGSRTHMQHVLKCSTINEYKTYIKTSDYWADEFAVNALAIALNLNIIILDRHVGINCNSGKTGDDKSSVIVIRDGQHYEALKAGDRSVFGAKSKMQIIKDCLKIKSGGGDDPVTAEEVNSEPENGSDDEGEKPGNVTVTPDDNQEIVPVENKEEPVTVENEEEEPVTVENEEEESVPVENEKEEPVTVENEEEEPQAEPSGGKKPRLVFESADLPKSRSRKPKSGKTSRKVKISPMVNINEMY